MAKGKITIRASEIEHKHLVAYCKAKERTQNDVLRELIRKLFIEGVLKPLD